MKQLPVFNKYILNSIFFVFLCSLFLVTRPISTTHLDAMLDEEITVNESFKIFIDSIIKKAFLHEEEHLLSPGLLNCYERYSQNENCTSMHLSDLIIALPELLKELDVQLKAPRPSPSHNGIAGPITCDLSQILSFLEMLKAKIDFCCQQQLDCCAELISDFQQTWTILAAISTITASVDFSSVFTVIQTGFNGTFSTLQDIKNTITACCENITNEFQQTWTILAAISTVTASVDLSPVFTVINEGFNSTFSSLQDIKNTITACCANIKSEFQQTWTILAAGFNGTFSAIEEINTDAAGTFSSLVDIKNTITACCENITNEFQQTWTILAAGFNGTFSSLVANSFSYSVITDLKATLSTDFNQTWTILAAGFNGTFSALQDIKNTLTSCCSNFNGTFSVLADLKATLSTDFNQTWTILAAGFNGTFSSLVANNFTYSVITDLKATLSTDFNQTWTILAAGFNGTFSALQDIKNTLTSCCSNFNGTFSVLADLKATLSTDFNQTWTILAAGFNGTFSALQDIKNTLTSCCSNFNGTFSVLADLKATLSTDFNQTWTILAAGFNGTFSTLRANAFTYSVITDLKATLSTDFNQTWTILADLKDTITNCCPDQGFISVFGDEIVGTRQDYISVQFPYGVSNFDTTTVVANGGLVQSFTAMAVLTSGTGATAVAQIQSKRNLRYRPGHEGHIFFTAMFPNGAAANSTQWIGLFDNADGAAIGYNGITFSILFRQNSVDTIIPQASFNVDTLNGAGPSGLIINPANINVFRIAYGWLGAAPIKFQIIDQNGDWITFHQILLANTIQSPTFLNPILPIRAEIRKTAGATNLSIATASWNGAIVGEPSTAGSRFFTVGSNTITLPAAGETHLLTIRNKTLFQSKLNKVEVRISLFTGGTVTTASETSLIRLRKSAVVTGPAFTNVDTANSVTEFSTAGTYVAGTGTPVLIIPNNTFGSGPFVLFLPQADFSIFLLPGESITITGESLSGGGNLAIASLGWEELF